MEKQVSFAAKEAAFIRGAKKGAEVGSFMMAPNQQKVLVTGLNICALHSPFVGT